MNKREKIVQKHFLDNEETVIKRLRTVYDQSLKDITSKIADLDTSIGALQKIYNSIGDDELGDLAAAYFGSKKSQVMTPEEAKSTLQSQIQSKVYQKNYQEALKKQVGGVMDTMQEKEFKLVSDYLQTCYEDGFIGTMFELQGQGIPLCFPLDQTAMVRAVQLDSKISQGLYSRLGEDVALLKKRITAEVSRGISTGMTFKQVARQLAGKTNIGYNNAVRIARTEGHRIQGQSQMDACYKAREKGANVVKQWDSTLDSRTRESHMWVHGEIRELDEKFSNGLRFPGDPSGKPEEVINCRCRLNQRARWALDGDELERLKKDAEFFGLDKTENFEDFKKKYLIAAEDLTENSKNAIMQSEKFVPAKTIKEAEKYAQSLGLDCSYKGVELSVANEMNAAFARGLEYCPDITKQLHRVGSAQERNRLFKADMAAYYDNLLRSKFPGQSERWYQEYAKKYASKTVGTVSGNTYAFASRYDSKQASDIISKYTGIFVNNKFGKDAGLFLQHLQSDVKSGWHPIGCDTIASVFDHEMAHQIDYAVGLSGNREMAALWQSLTKQDVETGLSRYGAKNIAEFIAEGYAEWCCNPNPRELATKIGNIIERAVKNNGQK